MYALTHTYTYAHGYMYSHIKMCTYTSACEHVSKYVYIYMLHLALLRSSWFLNFLQICCLAPHVQITHLGSNNDGSSVQCIVWVKT